MGEIKWEVHIVASTFFFFQIPLITQTYSPVLNFSFMGAVDHTSEGL